MTDRTFTAKDLQLAKREAFLRARQDPAQGCKVMERDGACERCEAEAERLYPLPHDDAETAHV